ncbi:MAG: BREX-6 system adenine-specific DNA-methyltransferase PglX, partial [Polyangiales bacterium]
LELVRSGGVSAMLTMRNWMFIKQYAALREHLLGTQTLRALGDVSWGAFREMRDNPVAISVVQSGRHAVDAIAVAPTDPQERVRTQEEFEKKDAGLLCQEGHHTFDPAGLKVVPEWPLVYWWDADTLRAYGSVPLLGAVAPGLVGVRTSDNTRFLRKPYEVSKSRVVLGNFGDFDSRARTSKCFLPYIKGARGRVWVEPPEDLASWSNEGLEYLMAFAHKYEGFTSLQNRAFYFRRGVAFSMIGASFSARVHRFPSVMGHMGSSVFPKDISAAVCAMNSSRARSILEALNPTVHFEVGDVNRLPLFPVANADDIFAQVEAAFTLHESHREPSVEFLCPGPSPWRHAQDWAQLAVDRPEGAPLPEYVEQLDPEPPTDHLSFALGVALGRFGARGSAQEGILDPATADLAHALPHGLLFLDTTLAAAEDGDLRDGLGHPAAAPLLAAWAEHRAALGTKRSLREWLATDFFKDVHKGMYENRPIHWPLSSPNKTFVAWVTIHRMNAQTLRALLADHLLPTQARLDGELDDLRAVRDGADRKAAQSAEKQYSKLLKAREELVEFIASVTQCADRGAPPTDAKCPAREQDQRYAPDLDDGVMINSAALWPLLEPQWKDPKKWWKELCAASGRKDYDWAHLALRYWPTRVDAKCQADPSLGVAHGCFWRYHPERAWAWELRLQEEIGPEFRIEEAPYRPAGLATAQWVDDGDAPHRTSWLRDHADEALAAVEKEAVRRMGRSKKRQLVSELRLLEPGLWSAHPDALWSMELRLSEKQGAELRVLAPDEPGARAAFEAARPGLVVARAELLKGLVPPTELFAGEDEDDEALDGDDEAADGSDSDEDGD